MKISTASFWDELTTEKREIDRLNQRITEREEDIPQPEIVVSAVGRKRALCPECKDTTLIRGYIQHYLRQHLKTENWAAAKGPAVGTQYKRQKSEVDDWEKDEIAHVVAPHVPNPAQFRSWSERSAESRAAIIAKYGNKMIK